MKETPDRVGGDGGDGGPGFVPGGSRVGTPSAEPSGARRLGSLDAFRGAIMLLMASGGLGMAQVAKAYPESRGWGLLARQCEHATWRGCTLWDLIQPAFMLMVGVALPWSLANRAGRGETESVQVRRVLGRSLSLVLLAVFLTSAWSASTEWVFTNVLAQIGLGYPFLYLLGRRSPRFQWVVGGFLLAGYWLLFALYPLPPAGFDWGAVGVPGDWEHLGGFAGHWEKNANAAWAFDRWFLNLFPRETVHAFSSGGYQTLNAVPSLVTMLWGVGVGRLLMSGATDRAKLGRLVGIGVAGVVTGWLLDAAGVCPIVKRIWTPSWTLFSAGWVSLLLAVFVLVVDVLGCRRLVFPLVVAGLNPITLYVMWQLMGGFVRKSLQTHLGAGVFGWLGPVYVPMLERLLVVVVFWFILLWMHRRRIYIRL